MLPFFYLQNINFENFHQIFPQQKNKGKPLFPLALKITGKPRSITSKLLHIQSLFLDSVKQVFSYLTLWQNPDPNFKTHKIEKELNNQRLLRF